MATALEISHVVPREDYFQLVKDLMEERDLCNRLMDYVEEIREVVTAGGDVAVLFPGDQPKLPGRPIMPGEARNQARAHMAGLGI